jgi:hypothetical protein
LILSRIFVVATRDLHGPDCWVAQIISRFGSGQVARVILGFGLGSTDDVRVGPGHTDDIRVWVGPGSTYNIFGLGPGQIALGPGKILKFRPVQTSNSHTNIVDIAVFHCMTTCLMS